MEAPMSAATEPVLSVLGVSKRFGGLQALKDVALDVRLGRLHSVVGPNGAGKSTLFNLICGIDRPDSGTITFAGRRIDGIRAAGIARLGLARKFQAPSTFPQLTVAENMRVAASGRRSWLQLARRSGGREEERLIGEALADMELTDYTDHLAGDLAHGEQQRLEIAMVLVTQPKLMLLDEPTAGLSADETEATGRLLRRLVERTSVLVVEHDLAFIRQVSDWVTVLDQGQNLLEGDVDTIAEDKRVRTAYLGRQAL
jgi:urea ABC transporter ATP-binding protein UrtD